MNGIINRLEKASVQKYELSYEDFTYSNTFNSTSDVGYYESRLDDYGVYAELLSATCTNTVNVYTGYFCLLGTKSGSPTYPTFVISSLRFDYLSTFPVTVNMKIRVYFRKNNSPVTEVASYKAGGGTGVSSCVCYFDNNHFTRI